MIGPSGNTQILVATKPVDFGKQADTIAALVQEALAGDPGVSPITIPKTNPGATGIKAIKFRDPEQHDLELIYFPPGRATPHGSGR